MEVPHDHQAQETHGCSGYQSGTDDNCALDGIQLVLTGNGTPDPNSYPAHYSQLLVEEQGTIGWTNTNCSKINTLGAFPLRYLHLYSLEYQIPHNSTGSTGFPTRVLAPPL
jgi:hypothetical protein